MWRVDSINSYSHAEPITVTPILAPSQQTAVLSINSEMLEREADFVINGDVERKRLTMKTNHFKIQELYTSTIRLKTKTLVVLILFLATLAGTTVMAATQPWGTTLGSFNNVPNYSNGSGTYDSGIHNTGAGIPTGLEWQCVEYVQRYYYVVYGLNLLSLNGGLNAWQFYGNATAMNLTAYANGSTTAPQVGDILCFNETGSGLGHVAIIRAVDQANSVVHVIQQNVKNGDSSPNGYGTDVD